MEVYGIGTKVLVGGDIDAEIVGISIAGSAPARVTYNVAWWDGKIRKSEWVGSEEFSTTKTRALTIGFN